MPYNFNIFTGNLDWYELASGVYLPLAGGTMSGDITLSNRTTAITSGNYPIYMTSGVSDGASAIGGVFDTGNLVTNGASIFQFKNNGVLKLKIRKDGDLVSSIDLSSPTMSVYNVDASSTLVGALNAFEYYGVRGQVAVGALTQNSNANTKVGGVKFIASYTPGAGNNYTLGYLYGINAAMSFVGTFGGSATITNAIGVNISRAFLSGNITNYYGFYQGGSSTLITMGLYEGMHFEAAPTATTKRGIVLKGDGQGNDLVLGAGYDATIYYDGTNLIINPKLVGTGVVSILGGISVLDYDVVLGTTTGTKIGTATTQKLGLWNVTPIIQPATNTYTTDAESTTYTGIDNLQAGTPYAQVADLENLRVAYENIRASYDDLLAKLKTTGIVA
jgi:hypothetical protein